jgi:SAM-dependent methyltransferase
MFQLTHHWIRKQIKKFGNEGKTLEIGSYYRKRSPRDLFPGYIGIDKNPGPGVDIVMDADEIISSQRFKENSFSRVLCISTLEHAPNFEVVLKAINYVLKPGGHFYLTLPAYGFPLHYSDPSGKIPDDYWRFSELAIKEVIMKGYKILSWNESRSVGPSGGPVINCLGEKNGI